MPDEPRNLWPDAFAGTAAAYAKFRPHYPPALLADLLAQIALPRPGQLLDLACGPGRIALDLAVSFDRVWAIDLEPEMIAVGKQEAARRGIGNVQWLVGRAEALEAPRAAFSLITIGDAFHRLEQTLICGKAHQWLEPSGCLVTMGCQSILNGTEPWQMAVAEVSQRWKERAFPRGWALAKAGAQFDPEQVLRDAGFVDVITRSFTEPHSWTFEQIIGYQQSTSVCSRKALAGDFEDFENDLASALRDLSSDGIYREQLSFGYTLGREPG